MIQKALEFYQTRQGNCAQAVIHAWNSQTKNPLPLEDFQTYGHGKAPEGVCGALYAAQKVLPLQNTLLIEFQQKTQGLCKCKDIRAQRALACAECVKLATQIIEKYQQGGKS